MAAVQVAFCQNGFFIRNVCGIVIVLSFRVPAVKLAKMDFSTGYFSTG